MSIFRSDNKKSPTFQRELYNLHYKRIYNICLRIIGNRMDAEEAMHDTFLKLFDHLDDLQNEKAFNLWSQQIAVRTSIDRIRKTCIIFEPVDDNLSIIYEDEEEDLDLSVETIKSALNNLPEGYRIIVSLRLFEEYEFKEIAQMLQVKESTIRSQFMRGRKKLSEVLSKMDYK